MCYGVFTSLIGLQENYTILSKLWQQTSSFSTITPGFMGDIDISKIKQSKNIRHKVPDTEELAKSIQQKGLLQPIVVRTLAAAFWHPLTSLTRMTDLFMYKSVLL
jgi:hypothetical protein